VIQRAFAAKFQKMCCKIPKNSREKREEISSLKPALIFY
jgi:hypothetical protein